MESENSDQTSDGWEWSIVEIFGHRRHVGKAREEERFGAKMLRVDVPRFQKVEGQTELALTWESHFYGGASIFSFTPTTEDVVMRAARPYERPALFAPPPEEDGEFDEG